MKVVPVLPEGCACPDEMMSGSVMHEIFNRDENSLDSMMQRMKYADDELIASITNSLKLHAFDVEKSQSIVGKVLSLFMKTSDPDWIELDDMRLM